MSALWNTCVFDGGVASNPHEWAEELMLGMKEKKKSFPLHVESMIYCYDCRLDWWLINLSHSESSVKWTAEGSI